MVNLGIVKSGTHFGPDTLGILRNIPKNLQYLTTLKKHTLEGRNIYSSLLDENPVITY